MPPLDQAPRPGRADDDRARRRRRAAAEDRRPPATRRTRSRTRCRPLLRPAEPMAHDADDDLLGLKWVTGFPANRAAGLAPIHALVILSDPGTGRPRAILDGGPITAQRTAAVSGVVVRRFGGGASPGRDHRCRRPGAQPRRDARRRPARRASSSSTIVIRTGPRRWPPRRRLPATTAASARQAVADADVVITAVTFARPEDRQSMTGDWLRPDALVVPIDYAAMCAADVARDAALFLTDDRGQFLANRDAGQFDGYPDPTMTIGEALARGRAAAVGGPGRGDPPRCRPRRSRLRRRDRPTRPRRWGSAPGSRDEVAQAAGRRPASWSSWSRSSPVPAR